MRSEAPITRADALEPQIDRKPVRGFQTAEVGVGIVDARTHRAVEAEVESAAEGEALLAIRFEEVAIADPLARSGRGNRTLRRSSCTRSCRWDGRRRSTGRRCGRRPPTHPTTGRSGRAAAVVLVYQATPSYFFETVRQGCFSVERIRVDGTDGQCRGQVGRNRLGRGPAESMNRPPGGISERITLESNSSEPGADLRRVLGLARRPSS